MGHADVGADNAFFSHACTAQSLAARCLRTSHGGRPVGGGFINQRAESSTVRGFQHHLAEVKKDGTLQGPNEPSLRTSLRTMSPWDALNGPRSSPATTVRRRPRTVTMSPAKSETISSLPRTVQQGEWKQVETWPTQQPTARQQQAFLTEVPPGLPKDWHGPAGRVPPASGESLDTVRQASAMYIAQEEALVRARARSVTGAIRQQYQTKLQAEAEILETLQKKEELRVASMPLLEKRMKQLLDQDEKEAKLLGLRTGEGHRALATQSRSELMKSAFDDMFSEWQTAVVANQKRLEQILEDTGSLEDDNPLIAAQQRERLVLAEGERKALMKRTQDDGAQLTHHAHATAVCTSPY
jgi:hypothetical protein